MTEEILSYEAVLALLSEQARAGKVAALVSLERAKGEIYLDQRQAFEAAGLPE
jgi:hypothetical protein